MADAHVPATGGLMSADASAMPRGVLVILNPAARHGEAARLEPVLRELLDVRMPWRLHVTSSAREATATAAACRDADIIVAAGGDGTVHEVVNGLMAHDAAERPALGVIPAGSGNDYAHLLGIPSAVSDAVMLLAEGRRRRLDVGRCNDTWFANAVSFGFDAKVTARAAELKAFTHRTGLSLYLRGA
jgi:diacylglycerol kinase family enzyme